MLNRGPYIKIKSDPTNSHLSEVKRVVKNSIILIENTESSIANCARFCAYNTMQTFV